MERKNVKRKGIKTPKETQNEKSSVEVSDLEIAKKMLKIYQSAVDRKLEFSLTLETVRKLLSYPTCYYTNRKFEEEGNYARSFDRIDSSKGYIDGNVVACTVDINGKKSNLSIEEIECLYKKLVSPKNRVETTISHEKTSKLAEPGVTGPQED